MGKIFLDTDVCLDSILSRKPFSEVMYEVLDATRKMRYSILMSEGSMPNLIYILSERYKVSNVEERLTEWLNMCKIASSNNQVIIRALNSKFKDKENSYQYHTALHNEVNYFITRNKKDYQPYATTLSIHTPSEFLETFPYND